ncbi:hypothetical protein L345_17799, partial [Ophiophagus hannah]
EKRKDGWKERGKEGRIRRGREGGSEGGHGNRKEGKRWKEGGREGRIRRGREGGKEEGRPRSTYRPQLALHLTCSGPQLLGPILPRPPHPSESSSPMGPEQVFQACCCCTNNTRPSFTTPPHTHTPSPCHMKEAQTTHLRFLQLSIRLAGTHLGFLLKRFDTLPGSEELRCSPALQSRPHPRPAFYREPVGAFLPSSPQRMGGGHFIKKFGGTVAMAEDSHLHVVLTRAS